MTKYYITERQNVNSYREGKWIEAKSLSAAKRIATREQAFCDTVLTIQEHCDSQYFAGNVGDILAIKSGKKWIDSSSEQVERQYSMY